MSTPRSAQKQLNGEAEGDVITQDVSTAPGKEREREPLYGGDIANISESMDLDNADGGKLYIAPLCA
jgi:SWI/SNF related-matrix-associated actin-dependent regulator of chromatin subfamily C